MITFISNYSFPSNNATANRLNFFINSLLKSNKKIKVKVISSVLKRSSNRQKQENITIEQISNYKYKNFLMRGIKELIFAYEASKRISKDCTFQIYTIPSPLILFGTYFRKTNFFAIDVRDVTWEYLEKKSFLGFVASKILILILNPIFQKAAFITCTNLSEKQSIKKCFKIEAIVIPNGIQEKKLQILSKLPSNKNFDSKLNVLYAGNIGIAQKLRILTDCAEKLNNFNFKIIGDGIEKKFLISEIKRKKLKNIVILPSVEWGDLLDHYSEADIFYAQITKDFCSAVPSKIFEYISIGKKIVLGLPDGPAKNIFSKFSNVFIHVPEDEKDFLRIIKKAENSKVEKIENNRELIKEFIRENHEKSFIDLMKNTETWH
tara:strand:- start:772 stop:1902 length:1131 start_codon:yes stop_codon:yes gene_type:complete